MKLQLHTYFKRTPLTILPSKSSTIHHIQHRFPFHHTLFSILPSPNIPNSPSLQTAHHPNTHTSTSHPPTPPSTYLIPPYPSCIMPPPKTTLPTHHTLNHPHPTWMACVSKESLTLTHLTNSYPLHTPSKPPIYHPPTQPLSLKSHSPIHSKHTPSNHTPQTIPSNHPRPSTPSPSPLPPNVIGLCQ